MLFNSFAAIAVFGALAAAAPRPETTAVQASALIIPFPYNHYYYPMKSLLVLLAFVACALAATGSGVATVDLIVTYPNGHTEFQYQDRAIYTVSVRPTAAGNPPLPTGSVEVRVDGQTTQTCALVGPPSAKPVCAVNETTDIPVGSHQFSAHYLGDANYAPVDSDSQTINVFTTIVLTITSDPSGTTTADQAITFTATFQTYPSGQTVGGNITILQTSPLPQITVGTCQLTSTSCSVPLSANTLSNGNYTFVGQYSGSTSVAAATSSSITIIIGPSATTNAGTTTTTNAAGTTTTTNAAGTTTTTTNAAGTTTTNAAGTTTTNAAGSTTTNAAGTTTNSGPTTTNSGPTTTNSGPTTPATPAPVSTNANGGSGSGSGQTSTSGASTLFASATIIAALFSAIML